MTEERESRVGGKGRLVLFLLEAPGRVVLVDQDQVRFSSKSFFFSHLGGFVRWRRDIFSSEERVGPAAGWLHPIARRRAASCPDGQRNLLNCPPPPSQQPSPAWWRHFLSRERRRRRGGGATARTRRGVGGARGVEAEEEKGAGLSIHQT